MTRRRPSPLPTIAAIVFAVALALSLFANWSLVEKGEFTLPGFSQPIVQAATKKKADEQARILPEMQAVFVPARPLPAFHQITSEDFINDDGTQSFVMVAKSSLANSDSFVLPSQSIGKVLRRPKSRARAFHPTDFFPDGTRPGLSAGVPAGMVGNWVECDKVSGLEGLLMGDVVDLMASSTIVPVDPNLTPEERALVETERRLSGLDRQAEVRRIVERAIVVQPVMERAVPGSKVGRLECYLAMQPAESTALLAALEVKDQIHAIARSGRVDETGEFQLPEVVPQNPLVPVSNLPKPAVVESIEGAVRSSVEVERADG